MGKLQQEQCTAAPGRHSAHTHAQSDALYCASVCVRARGGAASQPSERTNQPKGAREPEGKRTKQPAAPAPPPVRRGTGTNARGGKRTKSRQTKGKQNCSTNSPPQRQNSTAKCIGTARRQFQRTSKNSIREARAHFVCVVR